RIRRTAGYRPLCIRRLSAAPPCALLPACNFPRTASYCSRRVPCTTLGTSPDPAGFRRSRVRRGLRRARSRSEIGAIYDLPSRRGRLRLIRGDRQDRFREHGTKVSPASLGTTISPTSTWRQTRAPHFPCNNLWSAPGAAGLVSMCRRWPSSRSSTNGRESLRWLRRVEPPILVTSVGHLYSSAIILGVSSTLVHVSRPKAACRQWLL